MRGHVPSGWEPCCDSALPHEASDHWRCVWCGDVFRSCAHAAFKSVAKANVPEFTRCHAAVDVDTLSSYSYCSESCYAQSMPPRVREEQLQDFLTFCTVRDAISILRAVMSTQMAFEVLIAKYEKDGDEHKEEWAHVLRHMYRNTKTPIYSILAPKDPCVRHFHQLIQAAISLGRPRLFFVVLQLFSKCTNNKMMLFLQSHMIDLVDEKEFVGWLASGAKSDLDALEVAGGLTSCTKLGNGPNNRRVPDIMKGLGAIAEADVTILQRLMHGILAGEVECNSKIRELSTSWGFNFVGEFKSYFASKMLHAHVDTVSVATVVGPNLEVGRDAGAFNTLFGAALLEELDDAEHIYLLRLVAHEGRSRSVDKVTQKMLDDDYEHGLCEWVKARRGKASYENASKKFVRGRTDRDKFALKSLRGELGKQLHVVEETMSDTSNDKAGQTQRTTNRPSAHKKSKPTSQRTSPDSPIHNEMVRNAQNFDALRDRMGKNFHKVLKAGREAVRLRDLALDRKVGEGHRDDERKSRRTRDATDFE